MSLNATETGISSSGMGHSGCRRASVRSGRSDMKEYCAMVTGYLSLENHWCAPLHGHRADHSGPFLEMCFESSDKKIDLHTPLQTDPIPNHRKLN